MNNQNPETLEAINELDRSEYDVDGAWFDYQNSNVSDAGDLEQYRHTNIVQESITNGQFRQARWQCEKYGLNYSDFKG